MVTNERAELLMPFAFLEHEAGLRERLSRSAFLLLPSGFFACTVLTKESLLAQTTEECSYGALGKSWFMSGKLGAGAGLRLPAHPARLCADALSSLGNHGQE